MSLSSIDSMSGPLLDNISAAPQGPTINQIAAFLDANSAETSAVLQLIQSVGQAPQTQVGYESSSQGGAQDSGGRLSVYA
jgi:hypothetical protein